MRLALSVIILLNIMDIGAMVIIGTGFIHLLIFHSYFNIMSIYKHNLY